MTIELLGAVPFLRDLPQQELQLLLQTLRHRTLPQGDYLFHEGESSDSLFIVKSGKMDVLLGAGTEDEALIASIEPGHSVGELSLLMPGGRRSASVRATVTSELWEMTRADFDGLLQRQPDLSYQMLRQLSLRMVNSSNLAFDSLKEKNEQLQTAYNDLKAAQAQLVEQERWKKEMQLAEQIQLSILPKNLPAPADYTLGARMDAALAVGGDFYDAFWLDETRIGVLIGDVTDKGAPAAIFMARVHALLTAQALRGGAPAQALQHVNAYLASRDESSLFVTALYGILDIRANTFTYARAGHEIPLLRHADGHVINLPRGTGMPIGITDQLMIDEQTCHLKPGESILLISDGMSDCRNEAGEPFGYARLQIALSKNAGQNAQQTCDALRQTLADFCGTAPQDDDITLFAIQAQV
jgi:phosphoserine phosphatase RsbU/P